MFLAAAEALGVDPAHCAVFEDAVAGVEAGRAGAFGWVVGVDRVGQADALRSHGADRVVSDLERAAGGAVIEPGVFTVEPWAVAEPALRLDLLAQTESIFALSNGHIGLRGNLDEGEPHGVPGTYLNGFFETLPLPYAEGGYGYPEEGQSLINVTNGKLFRLLVDDEPFDVRYGTLLRHERVLDLRDGVLRRDVELASRRPARRSAIRSTRLVSFVQRAVAAIRYEVEAVDAPARIVVQSTPRRQRARARADRRPPRGGRAARPARRRVPRAPRPRGRARPPHAGQRPADGGRRSTTSSTGPDGHGDRRRRASRTWRGSRSAPSSRPGRALTMVKLLAYGWSSRRSMPALRDQVDAALAAAKRTGWEGLVAGQRAYLDDVWDRADVEVDGDPQLQQAVRFALFQVRAGRRPGRAARDPGQGPHRPRLRRPHVLGHGDATRCRC